MFYHGNMPIDCSENGGWIVGIFKEGIKKSNEVEVKYWEFDKGCTGHLEKVSSVIEVTILISGVVTGTINGEPVKMTGGDYVVIEPGTPNNIPTMVEEYCTGITVKSPSDPTAKRLI